MGALPPAGAHEDFAVRCFLAIDPCAAARAGIAALQAALRAAAPPVPLRWVDSPDLHLTLHFFGELADDAVKPLACALDVALRDHAPFELALRGLGGFPSARRPRLCWLGVDDAAGALAELHATLCAALAERGFVPEARAFVPHLTLARLAAEVPPAQAARLGAWLGRQPVPRVPALRVDGLQFFRSDAVAGGARYTRVARIGLGDGSAQRGGVYQTGEV